jgi:UPF0716 protein FxsA
VFVVVLLLIVLVPVAELIVMFNVADAFGWLETLSVLLLISVFGAWLVRHQGLTIVGRIQRELSVGTVPTKSVVDGLLLLVAGVLLFIPDSSPMPSASSCCSRRLVSPCEGC